MQNKLYIVIASVALAFTRSVRAQRLPFSPKVFPKVRVAIARIWDCFTTFASDTNNFASSHPLKQQPPISITMTQETSSSTNKKTSPVPTTHIPVPHPTTSRSGGGIEDYYYWMKTVAQEKAAKAGSEKKSFRRGRIWV